MLKSIRLVNFQCHKDLYVELDRITVLCGENDAGKSAVLRALRWVALNEWDGEANTHVTWGEEYSEVEIQTEKDSIVRKKGKDCNLYVLNGEPLTNIRPGSVPASIQQALSISGDNLQGQSDPAYWLSLNNSQAASALNEIFNLTAIDTAMSNMASELRQARSRESISKERLTEAQKTKKDLDWTVKADEDLQKLEELADSIQALEVEIAATKEYEKNLQQAQAVQKNAAKMIALGESALEIGAEIVKLDQQIEELQELLSLEDELCQLSKSLQKKEASLAKSLKGRCPLCKRGE